MAKRTLRVYVNGKQFGEEKGVKPDFPVDTTDRGRYVAEVRMPEGQKAKVVNVRRGKKVIRVDVTTGPE